MKTEPKNDLSEALSAAGASAPSLMPPVSRIEQRVRRRRTARTAGVGLASVAVLIGVFAVATQGNDSVANEVAGEVETAAEIVPTETASTAVGANVEDSTDGNGDESSEAPTTSSDSAIETDIGSAITQGAEEADQDAGAGGDVTEATTAIADDSASDSTEPEPEAAPTQDPVTTTPPTTTTLAATTTTNATVSPTPASTAEQAVAVPTAPAEATFSAPAVAPTVATTIAEDNTEVAAAPLLDRGSANTIPRQADSRLPFDAPVPGSDGSDESPAPVSPTTTTPAQSEPEATPGQTTDDDLDGSDSEETDPEPTTGSVDDPGTGDAVLAGRVIRRSGNCMPVIDGPRTTCLEEAAAGVEVRIYAAVSASAARNSAGLPVGASPVDVATTGADGRYSVTLPLGSYSVFVPDPEGEAMACSRSSGSVACPVSVVAAGATYSPVIDAAVY